MTSWGAEQALLWAQYNLSRDPKWYERVMSRAGAAQAAKSKAN